MTAETNNARGEWPERYACNGPEGTFWTDDAALANKLIGAAFDRDEWTVTDTQNPTGAATSSTAKPEAQGGGEVAAWETEDGRVISARQKATALRDGGASASSVAPYTTPLYRTAPPSAPVGVEGLIEAAKAAESMLRTVHECASHECEDCREYAGIVAKQLRAALAQQPEARGVVDGIIDSVRHEIERATAKFPTWPTDPLHACGVVQEESGELAKAALQAVYEPHKSTRDDVATEAIQTAAMAIRFLASMDRYDWKPGEQHEQGAPLTEARNVR